jgi:hypothetical protein
VKYVHYAVEKWLKCHIIGIGDPIKLYVETVAMQMKKIAAVKLVKNKNVKR